METLPLSCVASSAFSWTRSTRATSRSSRRSLLTISCSRSNSSLLTSSPPVQQRGVAKLETQVPLYKDPNQAVEVRVKDLLSRMTIEEKAAQMVQMERHYAGKNNLTDQSIGSVLTVPNQEGYDDFRATAEDWANQADQMQRWALASRLGIPIIYASDAVHGHNNLYGATIFPHNVGLGATRDKGLARRIGEATALEVRASGFNCAFAPCVAVCRDPRWGRCYESYSEEPEIVRMMSSLVSGLQGSPTPGHRYGYPFLAGRHNVIACAKHFVGDGGTHNGKNEGNTICSYEELEKIHMTPYLDCFYEGVCTVMVSYSSWNGLPLHSSRFLITDILKNKLGFKGLVTSDFEGIDRLSEPKGSNNRSSISTAINAGIDLLTGQQYDNYLEELLSLIYSKKIPMSRIDDAVERILRVKFVSGIFENPFSDRSLLGVVGCKEHRLLAREAVRKSLVLLKNGKDPEKPFLPLKKNAKRILVAGTHADNIGYQCGGWTITWNGASDDDSGRVTTGTSILEAITEIVGTETEVVHEPIPTASTLLELQQQEPFSYAIVVVGEVPYAEFEGDRTDLSIPFNGHDTISLIAGTIPTVVLVVSGRPLVIEAELLEQIEALVAVWLPGSEGGGVADCLFGDYDFHGVLPVSWFRSVDQLPLNSASASYDPLFPVGFGLRMFDKKL